jgi:glutathione synthase
MRVCFVVNNPRTQRHTYTTAHLGFAAFRRGHEALFVGVDDFSYDDSNRVLAVGLRPPRAAYESTADFTAALRGEKVERLEVDLNEYDVVFLRNNPAEGANAPVRGNPALEFGRRLKRNGVLVLNDPDGLALSSSKMYLSTFPEEVRPKTLITRSAFKVKQFIKSQAGPVILKPLDGFGGEDVFYVRRGQISNLNQMINVIKRDGYVIAQEYLPDAQKGDKRLLLLNGEPIRCGREQVAMYKRMRPKDDIRNNMHVGGQRRRAKFTEVERRISEILKPRLVSDGLYFVGVDIVGDKVLEVNVFSPGGIHNINELYSVDIAQLVIEDLEGRVAARAAYAAVSK